MIQENCLYWIFYQLQSVNISDPFPARTHFVRAAELTQDTGASSFAHFTYFVITICPTQKKKTVQLIWAGRKGT